MNAMEDAPTDTLIDFPWMQSKEVLSARRRVFQRFRWAMRAFLAFLLVSCAVLAVATEWDDFAHKWYILPLLAILFGLIWRLERCRFCRECNARYDRRAWGTNPGTCRNCYALLEPEKILVDQPGTLDLTADRYREEPEPVRKIVAMVILLGIKDRTTELRFESGREKYRFSYRLAGTLYDMEPAPRFLSKSISNTLKAMAGLGPERTPQAGMLRIKVANSWIDARIETQPTEFGENIILWIPELNDLPDVGPVAEKWADALLERYCRKTVATADRDQRS